MTYSLDLECLEDLFEQLGIEYNQRVIDVHRMRILRRFGLEVERLEAAEPKIAVSEGTIQLRAALAEIHRQCSRGMREERPVFAGVGRQLIQLRRGPNG